VLTPEEAHQLLTSRRKPAGNDEEEHARGLAKDLGYHALALDVTASALVSYGVAKPYSKFRGELLSKDDDVLELATELADALPNGHEASIAQTMLRSIRGLGAEGLDFLRIASVLAVAPVPASLVTAVFEKADGLERGKSEQHQRKAFHDVTIASLAEVAGENQQARSVHTLVSRAVRFHEKGAPERTQALRLAAVEALWAEIATAAEDPRLHKQIEFHVAHARQVVSTVATIPDADLLERVARYDFARGAYASAKTLCEHELGFRRRVLGPEHPNTVISMNDLAETLRAQGDLAGARKLHEEVLAICRRVLGLDHANTLTSMNNLASMLQAQGDMAGARKLHEETLGVRLCLLGSEHPDTLQSMHNLASTLYAQGHLQAARKLFEEVLAIRRRVLGPEHPDTLKSMNNLAGALADQGDSAGARKLRQETLAIRRRVLGPEHPDTLTSMNNLALTLYAQGNLAGARKLHEEALGARRRVLGPEHPATLTSMNNLALTLHAQGELRGARTLQEETLVIRRRVQGPEHPQTLTSMNNLAATLSVQGDHAGARKLKEETLEIIRRVQGPEHPAASISAWNLFRTLQDLGEHEKARALLQRDLLWLIDRTPATLSAHQRNIREWVAQQVRKVDSQ
jgi:tetratricopeptide (TPR) repeat protein